MDIRTFWSRVVIGAPDECWPWTGAANHLGYGSLVLDGQKEIAHRVAYKSRTGPIPRGAVVRHTCDNPPCCNPAHLIVGSQTDNMRDAIARGRFKFPTPSYGQTNCNAKLTPLKVQQIRRLAWNGVHTIAIARHFGIANSSARAVIRGETWAHVPVLPLCVDVDIPRIVNKAIARRGEDHGNSKLTRDDVREIRRCYATGIAMRELARRYGVSLAAIKGCVARRTWKCVA